VAPSSPVTATTSSQATPTPTPAGQLTQHYQFTLTRAGGYTASGLLSFGSPLHIGEASVSSGSMVFQAAEACEPDVHADAALPALVTITNTTPDYPVQVPVFVSSSVESPPVLSTAEDLREGPVCRGLFSKEGWNTQELGPHLASIQPLMFYIKGYYSPATPDGDASLLSRCHLIVGGGLDQQGTVWTLSSLEGPHVVHSNNTGELEISLAA
jgi:hypothetical protein